MPSYPDEDGEDADQGGAEDDSLDPLLVAAAQALEPTGTSPRGAAARDASSPTGPLLSSGTLIASRYRLDEHLGEGGMGSVWAATHVITRRRVAIKFLKGSASVRAEMRQRLFREARAASVVKHPGVVEVLDIFEVEGGGPVLVMDLLTGETLAARLAAQRVMSVREAAEILLPVAEAVEAAHAKGIVHRDLKPDNIFLHRTESGDVTVKVLDFGIAKLTAKEGEAANTGGLTDAGSIVGTPWYMAPEQCYGERDIDPRADTWALGVILYECIAGVRPLEGANVGQVLKRIVHEGVVPIERRVPGVPPELGALIGRMLSHVRENRPRDLSAVRLVLSALVGKTPSPAPSGGDEEQRLDRARSLAASGPEPSRPPARADTGASHAVPRTIESRSPRKASLPLRAVALLAAALAGAAVVHSVGGDHPDDRADRLTAASASDRAAAAARPPPTSSAEVAAEIPSPLRTAPAASATGLAGTPRPLIAPTQAPSARSGPARAAADAGNAAPSPSTASPASSQPLRQQTPEGRLYENVPF